MVALQYVWAHIRSGERYVVVTDENGVVLEAVGPLHHSEITAVLRDGFDSNADLVDDINAASEEYCAAPFC